MNGRRTFRAKCRATSLAGDGHEVGGNRRVTTRAGAILHGAERKLAGLRPLSAVGTVKMTTFVAEFGSPRIRAKHDAAPLTGDFAKAVRHPRLVDEVGIVPPEFRFRRAVTQAAECRQVVKPVGVEVTVEQVERAQVVNDQVNPGAARLTPAAVAAYGRAAHLRPVRAAVFRVTAPPGRVVVTGHERTHELDATLVVAEVPGPDRRWVLFDRLATLRA